ncbi:alanine racemase [Catellatospora sichuanensis]|uniref:alanine racemase n=1 Tax=Catellatospora sichuanensis TaxID=1969805 RepID=UPI0011828117|nr:alanine racemase [Catellatospora sichuanensis]
MWQASISIDLDAIRHNVAQLTAATTAQVMAVVKGDGYGHGAVESARAALDGGASRLGVATIAEALQLRAAGITAPTLAWLVAPGMPRAEALAAGVELSAGSLAELDEVCAAAAVAGRPAGLHLKVDTGLGRGGARVEDWLQLVEASAKAQADGLVEVVGVWSHFVHADQPDHATNARQLTAFAEAVDILAAAGLRPALRHIANSAAALTLPESHFDLVRAGSAVYGLRPMPGRDFGLRPAMTVRARVAFAKKVPAGCGVSYGHTYVTPSPTTLAVIPLGYADGIPRAAGNTPLAWFGSVRRTIAGRVSMDQFVVDCGDDPVVAGDVVTLLGPGDRGEPTADDWATVLGTVSYEIVANFGGRARIRRSYV